MRSRHDRHYRREAKKIIRYKRCIKMWADELYRVSQQRGFFTRLMSVSPHPDNPIQEIK